MSLELKAGKGLLKIFENHLKHFLWDRPQLRKETKAPLFFFFTRPNDFYFIFFSQCDEFGQRTLNFQTDPITQRVLLLLVFFSGVVCFVFFCNLFPVWRRRDKWN